LRVLCGAIQVGARVLTISYPIDSRMFEVRALPTACCVVQRVLPASPIGLPSRLIRSSVHCNLS
jgi:hypothetical protein